MPDSDNSTEALIQGWLEQTLTPAEAAELDRRLALDPALGDRLVAELRSDGMLREIAATEMPAGSAKAANALELSPSHRTGFRNPFVWLALAAVLAIAAIPFTVRRAPAVARIAAASGQVSIERNGAVILIGPGAELRVGDLLHTSAGATARLSFPGDASLIDLESHSRLIVRQLENGRTFDLRYGSLHADIAPKRRDQLVSFVTSRAVAAVKGTRFHLIARSGATWLRVDEGEVEFTNTMTDDPVAVNVTANRFAVAAMGVDFTPQPVRPGERMTAPFDINLREGFATGAGWWEPVERGLRQTQIARFPDERQLGDGWIDPNKPKVFSFYYLPIRTSGNVRITALVDVEAATPDRDPAGNLNLWRFGFGLRFPSREISLRMVQRPAAGALQTRVITPEWARFVVQPTSGRSSAPFEVKPGGSYRLRWDVRRLGGDRVHLLGKIWPVAEPEPEAWTVDTVAHDVEGELGAVNLDTYRAACAFRDFKAELMP